MGALEIFAATVGAMEIFAATVGARHSFKLLQGFSQGFREVFAGFSRGFRFQNIFVKGSGEQKKKIINFCVPRGPPPRGAAEPGPPRHAKIGKNRDGPLPPRKSLRGAGPPRKAANSMEKRFPVFYI